MTTAFSYLTSAELSDVGRRRKNNEDSLVCLPEAGVFCVADGMGGVQGGEVARKAAVEALHKEFTASPDASFAITADASARLVERALNSASKWIKERAEGLGLSGTGSTAVVLVFDRVTPSQGLALHAGDSRAYRLRGDKLSQLTMDHSVAAAAGLPDDSSLPPMFRGVITRAVGLEHNVQLEETAFDVNPGDLFLLCSDGLSKMVSDRRIQKLMRKHRDDALPDMAKALVDESLEEGGEDNVSVVVIRVAGDLPKGPTMEIPKETLELEKLVLDKPKVIPTRPVEDHDATGETAETGDVNNTASTMADVATPSGNDQRGITPTTPNSMEGGLTLTTPQQSKPAATPRPATGASSRSLTGILLVLALAVVGGGIWGFMEWQASRGGASRPPVNKPVLSTEPGGAVTNGSMHLLESGVPEHTSSAADLHGGGQE